MTRAAAYRTLLVMLGVLVAAVVVAILPVDPPPEPVFDGTPITRYGYTISLVLFVIPVAALLTWFVRHRRRHPHWRPFWLTFAVIVGLWSALDVLLAHTFFEFPNQAATVGIDLPGYDPGAGWGLNVPVEEFLFYISGCAFVLIAYIWSGEVWFAAYTSSPEEYGGAPPPASAARAHVPPLRNAPAGDAPTSAAVGGRR